MRADLYSLRQCVQFGYQWIFLYICDVKNDAVMMIISTREFRANQTKFLGLARKGEDVILKSRNSGSFRLIPVEEGVNEKRDLTGELVAALRQVKDHIDGKISLNTAESLIDELRNNPL